MNRNTINTYGWAPTGMLGRLLKKSIIFWMSFVVAHSQEQIEGIMETKTTFDHEKYLKFLKTKNMQSVNHSKIVIVVDNCRFHRTTKSGDILKERSLLVYLFFPTVPRSTPVKNWLIEWRCMSKTMWIPKSKSPESNNIKWFLSKQFRRWLIL